MIDFEQVVFAEILYQQIRDISQDEYSAGWYIGIENRVWFDAHNPDWNREYPVENVAWKQSLVWLAKKYDVWVTDTREVISIKEWEKIYMSWFNLSHVQEFIKRNYDKPAVTGFEEVSDD